MPISAPPPSWASIKNKPTTVAGFGITDMGSQTVANATNATNATTAANVTNVTTSQVAAAIAGISGIGVGAYVVGRPQNFTTYNVGDTIAGSSLYQVTTSTVLNSSGPAWWQTFVNATYSPSLVNVGTWRCMSPARSTATQGDPGLWIRIS